MRFYWQLFKEVEQVKKILTVVLRCSLKIRLTMVLLVFMHSSPKFRVAKASKVPTRVGLLPNLYPVTLSRSNGQAASGSEIVT